MKKILVAVVIIFITFISFIQTGCRNDKQLTDPPCDTSRLNLTYNGSIMQILNSNCQLSGCHVGNNPPNAVFLDTYQHVKDQLVPGLNGIPRLLGVIRHDPGFIPMPQGRPQLDFCTINRIKMWIDAGAPQ